MCSSLKRVGRARVKEMVCVSVRPWNNGTFHRTQAQEARHSAAHEPPKWTYELLSSIPEFRCLFGFEFSTSNVAKLTGIWLCVYVLKELIIPDIRR